MTKLEAKKSCFIDTEEIQVSEDVNCVVADIEIIDIILRFSSKIMLHA